MYSVIYSFKVKQSREVDFIHAWKELTKLIFRYENSLGSRLHKQSEQLYIAYAQWPDKATFENSGGMLPAEAKEIRVRMRSTCEEIKILYKLEVVEDLLDKKSN